jgi:hypothetical protein
VRSWRTDGSLALREMVGAAWLVLAGDARRKGWSLMGYTPLFDTMLSGTLYGRWPHTGVWACLLSRVSREGLIDETPQCLAGAIGIPVEMLKQCIHDFMQPDPESRTTSDDGRRLELIDPERSWGWRVINHQKYKEKARKKSYDEARTESGSDAERKRAEREASRDVPTRPDASRAVPLSSPTPTPEEEPAKAGSAPKTSRRKNLTTLPIGFELDSELRDYALGLLPDVHVEELFIGFCSKAKAKGWKYADWRQAWQEFVRNSRLNSGHWASGQYPRIGSKRLAI